jgi:two-component system, repressor protein LuxO
VSCDPATRAILIVEDDPSAASAFALQAEQLGFEVLQAGNMYDATDLLRRRRSEIVAIVMDLGLPDCDGLDLFRNDPGIGKELPVIVVTADGSINRAIQAMRLGAFDFLVKPIAAARLVNTLKSALQSQSNGPPKPAKSAQAGKRGYMGFVGTSAPMQQLYRKIARVALSNAPVLISGESGTGKELCAEALHKASLRAEQPMVAINCGAIPEKLLESQLFGHIKGAFTGAVADQIGAVQLAHRGTLFLDELCELELHLQVKLLRFVQTGTIQSVGCAKSKAVDVRIVCATNRDPVEEMRAGRLREDLYYRLAVIPMETPPLRTLGKDITLLANCFLQRFGAEEGRHFEPLSAERGAELLAHNWPGNVRELQNVMRRAAIFEDGPHLERPIVTSAHMECGWNAGTGSVKPFKAWSAQNGADTLCQTADGQLSLEEVERLAIERAIALADGSLPIAARSLGISPSTLYRKRERWVATDVQAA